MGVVCHFAIDRVIVGAGCPGLKACVSQISIGAVCTLSVLPLSRPCTMASAPSSLSLALSWLLPVRSENLLASCKFLSRSPYPLAKLLDGEMDKAITFFEVPLSIDDRNACLGANGSVEHVTRVLKMISGRWKLAILFRLFAEPSIRTSQLMRDIDGVSQRCSRST